MKNTLKILMLTPDFNLLCGRSKSVLNLSIVLKDAGHNVIIATNGGDNLSKINESKIDLLILKQFSEGVRPLMFFKSIIELYRLLSGNKFDIVHSHHRFFELVINAINIFFIRIKFSTVFTAHNVYTKKRPFQFKSDKIIAVNNFIKQTLINNFKINPDKIYILNNFLLQNEIDELSEVSSHKNDYIAILSSGRFDENKNIKTLLLAFNSFKNDKVKLYIVGEGNQEQEFKSIVNKYGLNVELLKPIKNYFSLLKTADICVLPSFSEGMSYFLLESITAGKFILASDIGSNAELLKGYSRYELFDPYFAEDIANKIRNICLKLTSDNAGTRTMNDLKFGYNYNCKVVLDFYESADFYK